MDPEQYIIYSPNGEPIAGDALPLSSEATAFVDGHDGYYIEDGQGTRIYPLGD